MTKNITLTMIVFLICGMTSFGQKLVERNYFQANPRLGGEVLINESSKETIGDKTYTRFIINADRAGAYTMNLWLMATELPDGTYSSYDVLVNGMKIDGRVAPTRGDWQNIGLTTGKVNLRQGKNTISFVAQVPEIPEIEFLRLSQNAGLAAISSAKYDAYKAEIKANIIEEPKAASRIVGGGVVNPDWPLYPLLNDTLGYASMIPWNQPRFTNPEGNYVYSMSIPVKYTYYRTVSLTAGQSFFVATDGVNNFGHILELFHSTKPEQYSWVNKANSRCLAAIDITVPETGTYYVRVRSDKNGRSGTTNLNINGQNYYNGIPLYSAGIRVTQDSETIYNTFTCYATTDPRIWIEEGAGSATPGKISAFNDDYRGDGDFSWGSNSRIKGRFPRTMHAVQVTAYSSSSPSGVCDLYAKCRNSAIYPYFPKLKADDAIQSAPESDVYKAFSWSGGITQFDEDPQMLTSQYHLYNDNLANMDHFYLSPRYNGCGIFSRSGATQANSVLDLYSKVVDGKTIYSCASVTNGADNHPHGYAWETKPGYLMRTFHPRFALEGVISGNIVAYYKRIGTGQLYTLAEAIADNKAVIEHVTFTDFERSVISAQKESMSISEINNFNTKYNAWKNVSKKFNSTIESKSTSEYIALINYCRSLSMAKYLVFDKLNLDDQEANIVLEDITLYNNLYNTNLLNGIKSANAQQKVNASGATIVRSPYCNGMKLVKNMLSGGLYSAPAMSPGTTGMEGISYSNSDKFDVIDRNGEINMNFTISKDSKISLTILDLNARPVNTIMKNQMLSSGDYSYSANVQSGIYLIELVINGNYNVKKFIVK